MTMTTLQPVLEAPTLASPTPAGPVKFVTLYGPPIDPATFERHYAETHVPLAHRLPGLQRVDTALILGMAQGGPAPYYRIAELWFTGLEQLQAAATSAEGQALAADVANFATGGLTVLIARVDKPGAVTMADTPEV
jgi:uncharacterized protein (TIGR02118 family)